MTYTSPFGATVGRDVLADQVVSLLSSPPAGSGSPLLVYYLADVERQRGLQARSIPIPGGYTTGRDFENWNGTTLPMITVVVQPTGDAERYTHNLYGQWFEIQIGATVEDPGSGDETVAERLADHYGAALQLLLSKNRGLGDPETFTVSKTMLISSWRTELVPDAQRWLAISVTTFHTFLDAIVTEDAPPTLGSDPYEAPEPWPDVSTVNVTVDAVPFTE